MEKRWTNPFTDVGENAWYYGAVEYAYTHGLMTGTSAGQFSPNLAMTRGMLATVLYRLAGEPAVGAHSFTDVPAGQYYTNAVIWAAQTGIVTGMGDNLFAPDSEITREQLATMLYRYAGSPAVSSSLTGFDDAGQVSDWAKQALTWAVGQGIIQGRTVNTLAPGANATRAEVAAMLQRFVAVTTTA